MCESDKSITITIWIQLTLSFQDVIIADYSLLHISFQEWETEHQKLTFQ